MLDRALIIATHRLEGIRRLVLVATVPTLTLPRVRHDLNRGPRGIPALRASAASIRIAKKPALRTINHPLRFLTRYCFPETEAPKDTGHLFCVF